MRSIVDFFALKRRIFCAQTSCNGWRHRLNELGRWL